MRWKTKLPICAAVAATAIALNFGGGYACRDWRSGVAYGGAGMVGLLTS